MRHLILEACNRVDFACLSKVEQLARLDLLACRGLTEFSWLALCTSLKRLVVTATPSSRLDLSGLEETTADELFLAIPKKKLLDVSKMVPGAAISNGDVWFRNGALGVGEDPLLAS